MTVAEKIKILSKVGFTPCIYDDEYTLFLDRGEDRFLTLIVYNYEHDKFYYLREKTSNLKEITKDDIMKNLNELHTTSKNHFVKIEEVLAKEGIILP